MSFAIRMLQTWWSFVAVLMAASVLPIASYADAPALAYLYPAGAQRGSQVNVRVGGLNLYDRPGFEISGSGATAPIQLSRMPTVWFEGPVIKQPASQQKEDYPQDYAAEFNIAADAPLGIRWCRARTAQGITSAMPFVIGHLPEVVEEEIDGEPIATSVTQPVTINGRIFPRDDIDLWTFEASSAKAVTLQLAALEIGSPLEAVLEVLDGSGQVVAEATGRLGRDPSLRFAPASAGKYTVRVRDVRGSGLQNHVYRLTITDGPWIDYAFPLGGKRGTQVELEAVGQGIPNGRLNVKLPDGQLATQTQYFQANGQTLNALSFEIDDLDDVMESASPGPRPPSPVPSILNGRIANPGELDTWTFAAKKGEPLKLEVRAARLGSPLDAVLCIKNAAGKGLARGEDLPNGSPDCEVSFAPPEDGQYVAEVSERFASRGGPAFAYRLRITREEPSFELTYDLDALGVDVGSEKKLPLKVQRRGGFAGAIVVTAQGLPAGVTASDVTIDAKQNQGQLSFKCAPNTPVSFAKVQIVGKTEVQGQPVSASARRASNVLGPDEDTFPVAVTLPTPFKYKSSYELKYIPRGTTLTKHYELDRGDYAGALRVQLAERQGRHLQGVTGPTITVPAGANEFEYTVTLPPWMELGRTSRTNLMLIGEIADAAGTVHQVGFSNNEQNEQLIAILSPPLVKLVPEPANVQFLPDHRQRVEVQLRRDPALQEAIRLELVVPPQTKGVTVTAVDVPPGATSATLTIEFAKNAGPFNAPLILRGLSQNAGGPVIAETPLNVVLPR